MAMRQIARILTLYKRLSAGIMVNKVQFAVEFDTTERSVDQNILAVRIFSANPFSDWI